MAGITPPDLFLTSPKFIHLPSSHLHRHHAIRCLLNPDGELIGWYMITVGPESIRAMVVFSFICSRIYGGALTLA
jgi:hypothetical protein